MEEDVNETPRLSRSTTGKNSALCCTRVGIDSGSDGLWRRQRLTITIAASINNFYQHKPRHRGRASGRNSDLYSDSNWFGRQASKLDGAGRCSGRRNYYTVQFTCLSTEPV